MSQDLCHFTSSTPIYDSGCDNIHCKSPPTLSETTQDWSRMRFDIKDYGHFIGSIETILRDYGLQHDEDGESVTEKIFFDMLVYRSVCASLSLQDQIATHLSEFCDIYGLSGEEYISLFGNDIKGLAESEKIDHIDEGVPEGASQIESVWIRFRSAYAKMQSTWTDLFPSAFYLDALLERNPSVKEALRDIIKKFQRVSVVMNDDTLSNAKSGDDTSGAKNETSASLATGKAAPSFDAHAKKKKLAFGINSVGDIFEYFLSCRQEKRANSRALGQYFTPGNIISRVLQNIHIAPGDRVLDYACGSGGFLAAALKKQPQAKVIGCEISTAPFRLAMLNLFFASKLCMPQVGTDLIKGDAFYYVPRLPHKVECILANPPFGVHINIYDKTHTIESRKVKSGDSEKAILCWQDCKDLVNPLFVKHHAPRARMAAQRLCNHTDSEGLFLSLAIACLAENGQAGIVFSHSILMRDSLSSYRALLLDTCTIQKIYLVPRNIFRNTTIETCVLIFRKNPPPSSYLIRFFDIQTDTQIYQLQSLDVCADPRRRLYIPPDYAAGSLSAPLHSAEDIIASFFLRDIAVIQRGDKVTSRPPKDNKRDREAAVCAGQGDIYRYPCYGSGKMQFFTDTYNREGRCCKVARAAVTLQTCVMIVDGPLFCADSAFTITSKDPRSVLHEYLWRVLVHFKQRVFECAEGVCQKSINTTKLGNICVSVARSLETQAAVVGLLETFYQTEEEQDCFMTLHMTGMPIEEVNKVMLQIQKLLHLCTKLRHELKDIELAAALRLCVQGDSKQRLGDLCYFQAGCPLPRKRCVAGEYPVVGGGQKPFATHNAYNIRSDTILCSTSGSCGFISKYAVPVWATDCFGIIIKPDLRQELDNEYLFYFLKSRQQEIYTLKRVGKGPSHVHATDLANFSVPVVPLEEQISVVKDMKGLERQKETTHKMIQDIQTTIQNIVSGKKRLNLTDCPSF